MRLTNEVFAPFSSRRRTRYGNRSSCDADRRVDAARHVQVVRADHFGVEIGAHAVQALEFERAAVREVVDRGDRVRVVRRELRIDQLRAGVEQALRAGEVRNIGVRFARVDGIAGEAQFLRALDFRIPVRAFDQAHAPAAIRLARGFGEPVDHERRALLVRLHGEAEAVPAFERRIGEHGADDVERELEAIGFFGVDGHADAVLHRELREREDFRRQFRVHACALGDFVARMQRGELDRDRRRVEHARFALLQRRAACAECVDRVDVGFVIALGVGLRQRGFAEHVVRIAVGGVFFFGGAIEGFLDRAAHDELVAHDAHRLAHGEADHRFAGAADEALQCAGEVAARFVGEVDELAGQHQAPGRGVDEHGVAACRCVSSSRLRRACRGSACRRWRCPECAAALRRRTSAARLPRSKGRTGA